MDSLDGLLGLLRQFEARWGFTDEDCVAVAAFVADVAARIDAANGDLMAVDWGNTSAWSFHGERVNAVLPSITVRHPPGSFSTYMGLRWDPNETFDGEQAEVGDGSGQTSCVPSDTAS